MQGKFQNENSTVDDGFILLVTAPFLQNFFFVLFATTYIMTVSGNIVIITITRLDNRLNTPKYTFLLKLALIEMLYTTAIIPNT
ncbi:hypothetical protein XELAEV_18010318mg [Xenopus laevis]|uniref:G-protein coupled receptors family 1 profile domain-containing protein n=1 Tax=Xenopus laevis TaxID=8355 RepID=A0A974DW55_XENLA|nr:hypothetical protein XELAEV_18010318mg [Xenopus laevis]